MRNQTDDGGPAFPSTGQLDINGMSLRDYFAAHAPDMPRWFIRKCLGLPKSATIAEWNKHDRRVLDDDAMDQETAMMEWRWYYADAMLRARKKSK